jgi:hypothetical protein
MSNPSGQSQTWHMKSMLTLGWGGWCRGSSARGRGQKDAVFPYENILRRRSLERNPFGWRCRLYTADTYRGDSSPYAVVHTTTPWSACMVIYRQFCTLRCKSIDAFVDYYSEFPSKHIEICYTRFSIFHKVGPSWNVTFVTHMCVSRGLEWTVTFLGRHI